MTPFLWFHISPCKQNLKLNYFEQMSLILSSLADIHTALVLFSVNAVVRLPLGRTQRKAVLLSWKRGCILGYVHMEAVSLLCSGWVGGSADALGHGRRLRFSCMCSDKLVCLELDRGLCFVLVFMKWMLFNDLCNK